MRCVVLRKVPYRLTGTKRITEVCTLRKGIRFSLSHMFAIAYRSTQKHALDLCFNPKALRRPRRRRKQRSRSLAESHWYRKEYNSHSRIICGTWGRVLVIKNRKCCADTRQYRRGDKIPPFRLQNLGRRQCNRVDMLVS